MDPAFIAEPPTFKIISRLLGPFTHAPHNGRFSLGHSLTTPHTQFGLGKRQLVRKDCWILTSLKRRKGQFQQYKRRWKQCESHSRQCCVTSNAFTHATYLDNFRTFLRIEYVGKGLQLLNSLILNHFSLTNHLVVITRRIKWNLLKGGIPAHFNFACWHCGKDISFH